MNAPLTRTLLLALTAVTAAPAAIAQQDDETLRFPGGTLAEFAAALRQNAAAHGDAVNVVLPDTAKSVQLPAIELTHASVGDALRAVATILAPVVRLDIEEQHSRPDRLPVCAVRVLPLDGKKAPSPPRIVRVVSLASVIPNDALPDLHAVPAETVLTAIETALTIQGETEAEIRFHEDSKLLFVQGTVDQVTMVEQVVGQLERDVRQIRSLQPPKRTKPTEGGAKRDVPADPAPPESRRR